MSDKRTRQFVLFEGAGFYATGGWHDKVRSYGSKDGAIAYAKRQGADRDWWHVVDLNTGTIVAGSKSQAWGARDLDDALVIETEE